MVRVEFYLTTERLVSSFRVVGHAGSGPYGRDVVCAAVSVLAIASVNGLERVAHTRPVIAQDPDNGGFLKVTGIDLGHDAQVIMRTFFDGMLDIQSEYSQHVRVKILG